MTLGIGVLKARIAAKLDSTRVAMNPPNPIARFSSELCKITVAEAANAEAAITRPERR
jgi:hypothetical protein